LTPTGEDRDKSVTDLLLEIALRFDAADAVRATSTVNRSRSITAGGVDATSSATSVGRSRPLAVTPGQDADREELIIPAGIADVNQLIRQTVRWLARRQQAVDWDEEQDRQQTVEWEASADRQQTVE
jgi:hypothetical protein